MKTPPRILLLAGSLEARDLAQRFSASGISFEAWLSETPREAAHVSTEVPPAVLRRFADAPAMQRAIDEGRFTAIVDASPAFDSVAPAQAAHAAGVLGLRYLRVVRPAWEAVDAPKVQEVRNVAAACAQVAPGARVFCATGWDSLPSFEAFTGAVLFVRQTRRHARAAPYSFVELVFADPPFTAAQEVQLFADLKIDLLICRNVGGDESRPKLDAAAALGLDVILIERPPMPAGVRTVSSAAAALAWVAKQ
jgi:precorrin-6A/cobalt-precorrin-6A reductase